MARTGGARRLPGSRARSVPHKHAQQVDPPSALESEPLATRHVHDVALVGTELHAMASLGELRNGDQGPLNSRDLESQGATQPLRSVEGRHLLAQVGQPGAIRGAVAAARPLHRRLLDPPRQQARRRNRLLGAAVDHSSDRLPAGWRLPHPRLVQAAEPGLPDTALHRQRAQSGETIHRR